MAGTAQYTDDEIEWVLKLVVKRVKSGMIQTGFEKKFGRPLKANQVRYVKNKYGKDPKYNCAMLTHRVERYSDRRRNGQYERDVTASPTERERDDTIQERDSGIDSDEVEEVARDAEGVSGGSQAVPAATFAAARNTVAMTDDRAPTPRQGPAPTPGQGFQTDIDGFSWYLRQTRRQQLGVAAWAPNHMSGQTQNMRQYPVDMIPRQWHGPLDMFSGVNHTYAQYPSQPPQGFSYPAAVGAAPLATQNYSANLSTLADYGYIPAPPFQPDWSWQAPQDLGSLDVGMPVSGGLPAAEDIGRVALETQQEEQLGHVQVLPEGDSGIAQEDSDQHPAAADQPVQNMTLNASSGSPGGQMSDEVLQDFLRFIREEENLTGEAIIDTGVSNGVNDEGPSETTPQWQADSESDGNFVGFDDELLELVNL